MSGGGWHWMTTGQRASLRRRLTEAHPWGWVSGCGCCVGVSATESGADRAATRAARAHARESGGPPPTTRVIRREDFRRMDRPATPAP